MGKQPFISHVVNGYSRYDVPESKAFTVTPGILYPVRIDFINARDRVIIEQGIDVRSNPLAVPSFNPYTVRLHRFWVPLQLYHPEMRTNSSKFDMNDLSLNWIPWMVSGNLGFSRSVGFSNSLLNWLRISHRSLAALQSTLPYTDVSLPVNALPYGWVNADTYLAYWDIVRNYYGYSQWSLYSVAWPASWKLRQVTSAGPYGLVFGQTASFFTQDYGNLEFLDSYYESQFYPSAVSSSNNTYNRSNLFSQIINSLLTSQSSTGGSKGNGFPVSNYYAQASAVGSKAPLSQLALEGSGSIGLAFYAYFLQAHPMAVVPSNPDRFSRLLPTGSSDAVSMTGITTIPQLAIASRLQEYKDLLGAGGSRYSDWLETFFASKISHVDRPKLLFAASQTVNVQIIMNQAGESNFTGGSTGNPLGQQGGSIAFNDRLGRSQSYYFDEPGYLIDMLSIRPVYYWSAVVPDYLNYAGSDYFNPIYNDIGYQDVPGFRFTYSGGTMVSNTMAQEPCFNEFRSSYDEVLGSLSSSIGDTSERPLYAYWVQQRRLNGVSPTSYHSALFVDMTQVNSPFASNVEDNFFVNMSYAVRKKNLVNKTFATRLSNR